MIHFGNREVSDRGSAHVCTTEKGHQDEGKHVAKSQTHQF